MKRLSTLAVLPVFASLVYFAFASTSVRKWWQDHRRHRAESNTYG